MLIPSFMTSVVLAYKGKNLDDVANELERYHPKVRRFMATSHGEALSHIYNQRPVVVFIDQNIENGLEICKEIKTKPDLDIHTIYFVSSRGKINPENPYVNQWRIRGASPRSIVQSIDHILSRII